MSWSRACVVEIGGDEEQARATDYITTLQTLRDALQTPWQSAGPRRRLVTIELCASISTPDESKEGNGTGQAQDTRLLAALEQALAEHSLSAPREFFHDHLQLGTRFDFNEDIRIHDLPSDLRPHERFHLEYFEPRYFVPTDLVFPEDDETWTAVCASTGRAIQCHQWMSGNMLVIASRKVSFWSRRYGDDGSWDAIILCDPLNQACIIQDTSTRQLSPSRPFKHGWNIITARHDPDPNAPGNSRPSGPGQSVPPPPHPSHDSMLDDLRFYFAHHAHRLRTCLGAAQLADPSVAATLFAKKIVAAHYNHMLAFVTHQTASMRSRGWSLRRATSAEAAESRAVEGQWSRFRCAEFVEALAASLDALGLPRQAPMAAAAAAASGGKRPCCCCGGGDKRKQTVGEKSVQPDSNGSSNNNVTTASSSSSSSEQQQRALCGDWAAVDRDLQYLYGGFEQQRVEYDRITHSIAAFVQMKEAERSLNVAKLTTYFALILTPFAWLASFFSMDTRYLPDGEFRYVYWVVSVGVIALSVLLFQAGNEIKINDKKVMLAARRLGSGWKRNRRGRSGSPVGPA